MHLDALWSGELWTSAPERLNDPYEGHVYFEPSNFFMEDLSAEEVQSRIKALKMGTGDAVPQLSSRALIRDDEWRAKIFTPLLEQVQPNARKVLAKFLEDQLEASSIRAVQSLSSALRRSVGVLSLAASGVSAPMWVHYAGGNTGFCVEYDFGVLPHDDLRKRLCFPVLYSAKKRNATRYLAKPKGPEFNPLFGQYLCLLKGLGWAHEREWRILIAIGPDHATAPMAMPKPSGILVGFQAEGVLVDELARYCDKTGVPLRRMKLGNVSYDLEYETA